MVEIKFQDTHHRAVALDDGKVIGECTFSHSDKVWIIDHTFVRSDYGGQGLARKLVDCIVDEARAAGIKLAATCPYAIKVFREDKYKDIIV